MGYRDWCPVSFDVPTISAGDNSKNLLCDRDIVYAVCLREWAALSHKRDNEGSVIKASYYSIFIAAYLGDSLDSASEADFLLQKRSHQQIYPQIRWITGIQSLKSHSKRSRLYSSEDGKRPLIRNVLEHSRCSLHYPRINAATPVCRSASAPSPIRSARTQPRKQGLAIPAVCLSPISPAL